MIDLSAKQLFVFDFDGTLVQSNAIKRAAFYEMAASFSGGADILDELLRQEPPLDRYGICAALADRFGGVSASALADAYTRRCHALILAAPEVPGAAMLLTALRERGRKSFVNSATPEAPLRALVTEMPIGSLIDEIYGAPTSKAENLCRAMAATGLPRERTVMIGDGAADQSAADAIGCAFIGVGRTSDFKRPATVIDRLDDLIGHL